MLKAIEQDRLEVFPELYAHYERCAACRDAAHDRMRPGLLDVTLERAAEALAEEDRVARTERRKPPALRIVGDGLIRPPPAPSGEAAGMALDPNEVAFLLSDLAPSNIDVDALPQEARDRLYAAAIRIDASAPDEPSLVDRLGLAPPQPAQSPASPAQPAAEPALSPAEPALSPAEPVLSPAAPAQPPAEPAQPAAEPARPPAVLDAPGRRPAPRPWPVLAAAAAVILAAIGLGQVPDGEGRGGPPVGPMRTMTTEWAEVTVLTAERRCDGVVLLDAKTIGDPNTGLPLPAHLKGHNPCRYHPEENLGVFVRVEPGAGFRHLSVLTRAADGRVEVLHTSQGPRGMSLVMTRERVTTGCGDGACWLGDGPLDVPDGPLEVVAIFSDTALPLDAMRRTWAPMRWVGPDRLVQRFGIRVRDEEGNPE